MDSQDNAKVIPDDKLEQVSGGDGSANPLSDPWASCPNCGMSLYDIVEKIDMGTFWEVHCHCNNCGTDFITHDMK